MKWLEWFRTGVLVAFASSFTVAVLAAVFLERPDPYSDGFGQLALFALVVVSGLFSLAVSAFLMPIFIAACEGCFRKRWSVLVWGGVVAALALPFLISESFDPSACIFVAGPALAAIAMAWIANDRATDGA